MSARHVDAQRLWASIEALGQIGATPKGGVCRLALSDEDAAARALLGKWCADLGLAVTVDRVGNMFARRPGRADGPPVAVGSHIDSQPSGGRFDGAYGVLGGLEVLRCLDDAGIDTELPVELAVWTNEEGSRFVPAMAGSGAFAGRHAVDDILAERDRHGVRFGDELARIGAAGTEVVGGRALTAYLELHIEQGPVLEAGAIPIGVVTGCLGVRWWDVTVTGQDAHAGPTPMDMRRDAVLAAAEIIAAVDAIGRSRPPWSRSTCGQILASPNSRNVIAGRVLLTVDCRHLHAADLDAMEEDVRAACSRIAAQRGVAVDVDRVFEFAPTRFDERCIDAVAAAAGALGLPTMELPSGAGHDAVNLAAVAPTGMIFIPCRDGISHNELEHADPDAVAHGADVLLGAVLELAGG